MCHHHKIHGKYFMNKVYEKIFNTENVKYEVEKEVIIIAATILSYV